MVVGIEPVRLVTESHAVVDIVLWTYCRAFRSTCIHAIAASLETITVASRLECCGVSGIGGGTVAVIECPAMVYLDGSQIVDQVKAIIAVTPCTTIAYGIVRISGMLYMEAETVYITSIVTLAIVVVVVIGV